MTPDSVTLFDNLGFDRGYGSTNDYREVEGAVLLLTAEQPRLFLLPLICEQCDRRLGFAVHLLSQPAAEEQPAPAAIRRRNEEQDPRSRFENLHHTTLKQFYCEGKLQLS